VAAVAGKFFVKGSLQGTQWLYANVSPVFEVDSVVVMQCSDSSHAAAGTSLESVLCPQLAMLEVVTKWDCAWWLVVVVVVAQLQVVEGKKLGCLEREECSQWGAVAQGSSVHSESIQNPWPC